MNAVSKKNRWTFVVLSVWCVGLGLGAWSQVPGEAWERIAVLGHDVKCLAFSPDYANDQTIFAGTGGMGVWRSTDGGDTWTRNGTVYLATSIVTDLAISPSYPNDPTLFAITESGNVFVSTNANLSTWSFSISLPAPGLDARGTSLGISPNFASDGTVYAGFDGDGLYFTTNRGSYWSQDTQSLSRLIRLLDLSVDPNFASTGEVILGGVSQDGCLYLKTSGGWTKINGSLGDGDGDTVTSVRYEGNGRIWVGTKNNGAWHRLGWSAGWAACWDGVITNDQPTVHSLDRVGGSAPKFMEGRGDSLFQSTDTSGYGTSCVLYDVAHPVQVARFAPGWNGTTACTVFIGTPHGLLRTSCASSPDKTTTGRIDAWAVARAPGGTAHFMGSKGQGLFKHVTGTSMVRYNNFPNKQIPEIAAICLDPLYDEVGGYEGGDCSQDESVLFVAANFPTSTGDNGVYKSSDFGNTWTKLSTGWPASAVTLYDLAISPNYRDGGPDTTLYAATSLGIYRWNGSSMGWSYQWRPLTVTPVYRVAVPPLYNRTGPTGYARHGVFASTDDGTDNELWFSEDDGVNWEQIGYPSTTRGRVTGFAFDGNFGGSGSPSTLVVSAIPTDLTHLGGVFTSNRSGGGWGTWTSISPGSGSATVVWDVSAEPGYLPTDPSRDRLGCATNGGIYFSQDAGASWTRTITSAGFSVQYDRSDSGGRDAMVGLQILGARWTEDGAENFESFTGYHYLPDDVWATVAHERDPNILFSSSPSMGVFVSEDKGISYRPWNRRPPGTTAGPCVLRTGLGLAMAKDRRGTNLDVVWAGTVSEGIKVRYIYYDAAAGKVDLEMESATAPNGWRHCTWYGTSTQVAGRWERIETVPNTGTGYPVWASSQTGASAAQGMAALPEGTWYSQWRVQNTNLPSLETRGMRQGYGEPDPVVLLDGQTVGGEVAYAHWDYYSINVPTGTDDLQVYLNDLDDMGPQDPDLYLRFGGLPTTTSWDFRPYINGDESVCVTDFTLLDEDFNGSWGTYGDNPPPGWTILDGGDEASPSWNANDWHKYNRVDAYGYVARVYYSPLEHQDEVLITPEFDLPSTAGAVNLEFDHWFDHWDTAPYETCTVRYRSDQHPSWVTLATYTNDTANMAHVTLSLLAYAGDTDAQIGFRYYANDGFFWQVDNVRVSGTNVKTGTWYIGVRGYSAGTSPYELTASLDSGCSPAAPEGAAPAGTGKDLPPACSAESVVDPKAPRGNVIWGTVNGPSGGIYLGTGDPAGTVTWEARNGAPPNELTNLSAQTVFQLTDMTLVAGCSGDVFYSPTPDEGLTTWVNATSQMATQGSNDFRDLLEASNGDVLVAAHGLGTGSTAGGVWLSGDQGAHWMRLSQGFDADKQLLTDLMADGGTPPQYYSSTDGTGVYSRTITAQPYPTVAGVDPATGSPDGGSVVTVTGTGFSTDCPTGTASDCPDASPVVLFGDTEVSAIFVSATELRAVSPVHAAGAVTVRVRNPDTRRSVSGRAFTYACEAPSGLPNNTASDLDAYADTGVLVTWSDPSDWNDGGSGTRSFAVYRNGSLLQGGLPASTHAFTDLTGANRLTYTYAVRVSNGCGQSAATAGAAAADEVLVPGEVSDTSFLWSAGTSETLTWSAATGATSYRVYRGDGEDVGDLPGGASVCLAYEGAALTTGATLSDEPPSGGFYWYLVVGVNEAGEGSAGDARVLTSTGACSPP